MEGDSAFVDMGRKSNSAKYEAFYPESRFGGFTDVDGTICFYNRVASLITSSTVLLDFGCGRGEYRDDPVPLRRALRAFRGRVLQTIGVDVDDGARENPFVDEFRLLRTDSAWPVDSDSVDVVIADSVLEHLPEPASFFSESRRVLHRGGHLCIRTTNLFSYVGLASRIVPNRFHKRVLEKVQPLRREKDIFPTHYRCNTLLRLRRMLSDAGFEHVCYGYESEPHYLSFSRAAFFLGVLHQRYAPRALKPALFAFGRSR